MERKGKEMKRKEKRGRVLDYCIAVIVVVVAIVTGNLVLHFALCRWERVGRLFCSLFTLVMVGMAMHRDIDCNEYLDACSPLGDSCESMVSLFGDLIVRIGENSIVEWRERAGDLGSPLHSTISSPIAFSNVSSRDLRRGDHPL
jgi:hypothetical protein